MLEQLTKCDKTLVVVAAKNNKPSQNRRALERAVMVAGELAARKGAEHRVRQRIIEHIDEGSATQAELAARIGKTPPGLHRIISGLVSPQLRDLDVIAKALGLTPEQLVAPLEGDQEGRGVWSAEEREVLERLRDSEDREKVFRVLRTLLMEGPRKGT